MQIIAMGRRSDGNVGRNQHILADGHLATAVDPGTAIDDSTRTDTQVALRPAFDDDVIAQLHTVLDDALSRFVDMKPDCVSDISITDLKHDSSNLHYVDS
ncbi:hypothetical protein [Pseudomonas granadensis]|uniref:hypothetical protein n=1 Tax=Pseudomonas granadensis TaxID=1421430 RepID=UPI001E42FEBD|nr:hypothetical protein [Pseudomonas granadensis]